MSRVLLVGKGPPDRGGIAGYLDVLASGALSTNHDVRFLNVTREEPADGPKVSLRNVTRALTDARAVWHAARDRDIVHVHSALAGHAVVARAGLLALTGRARGCAAIVHAHSGRVEGWFTTGPRRLAGRMALAGAHRVVAVAEGGHRALARTLGSERVLLLRYGVEVSRYGPAEGPHDPPRILFAGVLTPRKGVLELLEASRLLAQRGVPHELVLIGGTPAEGAAAECVVRDAASRAGVTPLDPRPHEDMPPVYRCADVFCLPSWGEAMPLSVLEAMASGLPVVGSRVGDIPHLVDDGVTGRVVAPRDAEGLADALEDLVRDPALRRRMGTAGRRRVEELFSLSRGLEGLNRLYTSLNGNAS